jgi:hypothetical protein
MQARAALRQHRDVMQAAEKIFEGKFDNVQDEDGDVHMASTTREVKRIPRLNVTRNFYAVLQIMLIYWCRHPTPTMMMNRENTMTAKTKTTTVC